MGVATSASMSAKEVYAPLRNIGKPHINNVGTAGARVFDPGQRHVTALHKRPREALPKFDDVTHIVSC
jgi:hypothetical protein